MPPPKPQSDLRKKPVKKIRILELGRSQQRSLVSEHFYLFLAIVFAVSTFLLQGFGLRLYESAIVGLWIVAIVFSVRQVRRFIKGDAAPRKEAKKDAVVQPVKPYTPPALPRVSKDFSPMPPAGDKRYPPPSPFIKPPK
jgi:hypothetical protein